MRPQREKCCVSVEFGAAAQRENQPFVRSTARIKGRIHRLRRKPDVRCSFEVLVHCLRKRMFGDTLHFQPQRMARLQINTVFDDLFHEMNRPSVTV